MGRAPIAVAPAVGCRHAGPKSGCQAASAIRAATRPERRQLEHIRRGQLEGLAARMADAAWQPDFGPACLHPTAGATAIGARPILIAYNINLDTDDVQVARQIAAAIRTSSGGLPAVKAMGLLLSHRRVAQVSINLTDHEVTALHDVFKAVKQEADRRGVTVLDTEIVGMVPARALIASGVQALRLAGFRLDQVLDFRL